MKFRYILILLPLGMSLVFFQNCGQQRSFNASSEASSAVPSSYVGVPQAPAVSVEVVANSETNSPTPDIEDRAPAVESIVFSQSKAAHNPEEGELHITLFFDDSRSNVGYAQQVFQGIDNLINSVPREKLKITAYSLNSVIDYPLSVPFSWSKVIDYHSGEEVSLRGQGAVNVESSDDDRKGGQSSGVAQNKIVDKLAVISSSGSRLQQWQRYGYKFAGVGSIRTAHTVNELFPPMAVLDGSSVTSSADWVVKRAAFRDIIEKRLAVGRGGFDSNPEFVCNLLAKIASDDDLGPNDVNAIVVVTDEDANIRTSCTKESTMEQVVVRHKQEPAKLSFTLQVKRTLEGGVVRWNTMLPMWHTKRTYKQFSTCAEALANQSVLRAALPNGSTYKPKEGTYTAADCEQSVAYIAAESESVDTSQTLGWLSNMWYDSNNFPDASEQLQSLIHSSRKGQMYIGLFSLQEGDPKSSVDQEPATRLKTFIASQLPAARIYNQSLLNRNYGQFIDNILNFRQDVQFNRFSVADLIKETPDGQELVITAVKIRLNPGDEFIEKSFSFASDEITVHDPTLDLSGGFEFEVFHHFRDL